VSKRKSPSLQRLESTEAEIEAILESMFDLALNPNADGRARVEAARLVLDGLRARASELGNKCEITELLGR
jgi:hypothetical protein